jgi:pyridoxal phosphate enzyme (YggS family)
MSETPLEDQTMVLPPTPPVSTNNPESPLTSSSSTSSSDESSTSTSSAISSPTTSSSFSSGGGTLLSDADLVHNLGVVQEQIREACIGCSREPSTVTLVAVSKTKPSSYITALYNAGHRHFGENYFQELELKAVELPVDINWHFIGHLQSSKATKLVRAVSNLVVESVDSMKLAQKLNAAVQSLNRPPMGIYIQIHTSDEETKNGIDPSELLAFASDIRSTCPYLALKGLMTIGSPTDSLGSFAILVSARQKLADDMGIEVSELALSMGMSGDFQLAIANGSSNVRIGSVIFGPRIQ